MKTNYYISSSFKKAWKKKILLWYSVHKRKLPWRERENQNFYKVWLSEVMLQQTTVKTVIPYYQKFIEKWPNIESFFNAELNEILIMWQGLGYYQRANNLFKAKEFLKKNSLKISSKELKKLPGIGDYISCSISAILNDEQCAVVDGNIKRILSRVFSLKKTEVNFNKTVKMIAQELTPKEDNKFYCQSLMDLANLICKARNPLCNSCPINNFCQTNGKVIKTNKKPAIPKKVGVTILLKFKDKMAVSVSNKKMFQGLFQLPLTEYEEYFDDNEVIKIKLSLLKKWAKAFKKDLKFEDLGLIHHKFSHFHLKLFVVEIVLNREKKLENFFWMTTKEFEKKPISNLMQKVNKFIK